MKQVKCKSGITGFQCKLQANYNHFIEFKNFDKIYNLAKRLGFKTAKDAWDANPTIKGSVVPSDLEVVNL